MVQLRTVLVIFVTLLCRELAGELPRPTLSTAAVTTAGIVLGVGLLFRSFALMALCQTVAGAHQRLARLGGYRRLTDWLWCLLLPLALLATGWAQWLRELESFGPLTLVIPLYFLPTVAVILLLERTAAEFEQVVNHGGSLQVDAEPTGWQRFCWRLKLGELSSLLTCLVPVLLMLLFSDAARCAVAYWLPDTWPSQAHAMEMGVAAGMTFMVLAFVYPQWMSRMLGTTDLMEPIVSRLQTLQERSGLRRGLIGKLLPSHGDWSTAAVVGWLPGFRQLWLGDRLLRDLTAAELDMVLLHELAHIKRWHFLWRLFPVLTTVGLLIVAGGVVSGLANDAAVGSAGSGSPVVWNLQVGLLWGIAAGCLFLSIGWVARWCELDADARACQLALQACEWSVVSQPQAVLARALDKLHDTTTQRGTWLHPSLRRRYQNLGIEMPGSLACAE